MRVLTKELGKLRRIIDDRSVGFIRGHRDVRAERRFR